MPSVVDRNFFMRRTTVYCTYLQLVMCLLSWDLRKSRLALDLSERNYSVNLYMHVRFLPKLRTDIVYRTV